MRYNIIMKKKILNMFKTLHGFEIGILERGKISRDMSLRDKVFLFKCIKLSPY